MEECFLYLQDKRIYYKLSITQAPAWQMGRDTMIKDTRTKHQQLKEYLQYVYKQYTSHYMEHPKYNMLTNQQMELNHAIRQELLK